MWSLERACLWHVYAMLGKLNRRVYLLSRDRPER